jgi:hypothetical protein
MIQVPNTGRVDAPSHIYAYTSVMLPEQRIRRLYHGTKEGNLASILSTGLKPRAGGYKSNVWPRCVFLVRRKRDADRMIRAFWADQLAGHPGRLDLSRMVTLTVESTRIPMSPRFYRDQALDDNYIRAVFTLDAIPTAVIVHVTVRPL